MILPSEPALIPSLPIPAGSCVERLRYRWPWFIVLGVLVAAMGVAALVLAVAATLVSVYIIAAFMILAGAGEIVFAVGSR